LGRAIKPGSGQLIRFKIAQHVIAGRLHIHKNIGCQDRVNSYNRNGNSSIALSDGAGSYQNSELGAEKITKNITKNFSTNFSKIIKRSNLEIKKRVIAEINRTLKALEDYHHLPRKEFSCTLLFIATNGKRYIAGHIGDGLIGGTQKKTTKIISEPENFDFANVTSFITSNDLSKRTRIYKGRMNDYDSFVLMSDGSMESLFDKKKKILSKSLIQINSWANHYPLNILNQALKENMEKFIWTKTHDDCSLIFLFTIRNTHQQLRFRSSEFVQEFLKTKNNISLINRKKILYHFLKNNNNLALVKMKTKLSISTIKRHSTLLKKLNKIIISE
jgi:hypothetical protein